MISLQQCFLKLFFIPFIPKIVRMKCKAVTPLKVNLFSIKYPLPEGMKDGPEKFVGRSFSEDSSCLHSHS